MSQFSRYDARSRLKVRVVSHNCSGLCLVNYAVIRVDSIKLHYNNLYIRYMFIVRPVAIFVPVVPAVVVTAQHTDSLFRRPLSNAFHSSKM